MKTERHALGYCPKCQAPGRWRERRPFGNDTCENGHTYPSSEATTEPTTEPATGFEEKLKSFEEQLEKSLQKMLLGYLLPPNMRAEIIERASEIARNVFEEED